MNGNEAIVDLKFCATERDLLWGKLIHGKAVEVQRCSSRLLMIALIRMYGKCRNMEEAQNVFDTTERHDVLSWNALLLGYAETGQNSTVFNLISQMKLAGIVPNSVTYLAALKACKSLAVNGGGALRCAREIHFEIGDRGDHNLLNALIDTYGKCCSMADAHKVFDKMLKPDVVSWNSLLWGYVENGEGRIALELFFSMKERGFDPDSVTYIAALKSCTSLAVEGDANYCLHTGKKIHAEVGCHLNRYLQNTLVDMYGKCGSMLDACSVFFNIRKPDLVSWNALLMGCAENGYGRLALDLYSWLKKSRVGLDSVTYVAALKACTSLAGAEDNTYCLGEGRKIHLGIGGHLNRYVMNTLIDMYGKLGSMEEARSVFDNIQQPDVISWTALLLRYLESGEGSIALDLFFRMRKCGCAPNSCTYVVALRACTSLALTGDQSKKERGLELGRKIHLEIECDLDNYVLNSLIDMYGKLGSMDEALCVFESIGRPDTVSWNSLLLGYVENGEGHAVLDMLSNMIADGFVPDSVTYLAALKACGLAGALALGREFHSQITQFTPQIVTCLVDFYAKCGTMTEAREIFDLHFKAREVPTWNALLAGYSRLGDSDSAINLFEAMQDEGLAPNAVTFVCLLLCCSHTGLLEKAQEFFEMMSAQYKIIPNIIHYNCMLDVLGRANQLDKAIKLIREMPCTPDTVTWVTLRDACRKLKNLEVSFTTDLSTEDRLSRLLHLLHA